MKPKKFDSNVFLGQQKFLDRAELAIRGSADDLRAKGLAVLQHCDRRSNTGKFYTHWVFVAEMVTRDGGKTIARAFEGEGLTDGDALDQVRSAYAEATDLLHHAPMCPANHYCGQRAPTGPCTCGAVELAGQDKSESPRREWPAAE